jgi:hypothetical protein
MLWSCLKISGGPLWSGSSPRPDAFPQEKVFEDKLSFPRGERTTAGATGYLARIRLRTGFDFDDLVECLAVRACEWTERRRPASHDTPPIRKLIIET